MSCFWKGRGFVFYLCDRFQVLFFTAGLFLSLCGLHITHAVTLCHIWQHTFLSVADVKIILAFGNYMNSSKRGAAYGFRLQSLDLVRKLMQFFLQLQMAFFASVAISVDNSKIFCATCCFYRSNVRLFILCWLSQAVGHQIYRPKTDTDALHRQHHPGEIPRAAILPHRAALPG